MQKKSTNEKHNLKDVKLTIIQQACVTIPGFSELYNNLERFLNVNGKSKSALVNYARHLAHLAIYYQILPTQLQPEQVLDYLHMVKTNKAPSLTFFKFTVYGLRVVCKIYDLPYKHFELPALQPSFKLPAVLNKTEVKQLFKACTLLKHRLLIGLCYGCGLRCGEVRNLRIGDIDLERGLLHVRQGKNRKDRILPLGRLLPRGIKAYLETAKPKTFLLEGLKGRQYSSRGSQWALQQALKKTTIMKQHVSLHTLRHSYATHLLENGVNILTIKELLGHSHIYTTMTYLHLANPVFIATASPLDTLYNQIDVAEPIPVYP